jgi:hypothetical protein
MKNDFSKLLFFSQIAVSLLIAEQALALENNFSCSLNLWQERV